MRQGVAEMHCELPAAVSIMSSGMGMDESINAARLQYGEHGTVAMAEP
jgi:hypothetical protein